MIETEIKNPSGGLDTQHSKEFTEDYLSEKLLELSKLEKELFNCVDGVIGGESNDSDIDKEYKKGLEKATDIKAKVYLVEKLIDYFLNKYNYVDFKTQKESEYLDEEDKKNIDEIEKEVQDLIDKYPQYKEIINSYIKDDFEKINFGVKAYEEEGKEIPRELILKGISMFLKLSYENLLYDELKSLKEYIDSVNNSKNIKNKQAFLKYVCENHIGSYYLSGGRIDNLFSYEIVEEGFINDEGSNNYNEESLYGILCEFITMHEDDIKKLNNLYVKGKNKELVEYIDTNLTLEQKNKLFAFNKIKNIYVNVKKEQFPNLDKFSNDLIIYLSNIKDSELKNRIQKVLETFISKVKNKEEVSGFFDEQGEFDKLFGASNNIGDKLYTLKLFEIALANSENNTCSVDNDNTQLYKKILDKFNGLRSEEINKLENKLRELKDTYKDDSTILHQINNDLYQINKNKGNTCQLESEVLGIFCNMQKYENSQGTSQKPEEKESDNTPEKQISESKRQEMQQKIDSLGLNVKVNNDGKMVGKNGEETIKQKIGNKSQIEVNANGDLILINSLGYKMKYENNSIGLENSLETIKTFDYLDKIGLGYFGNNLKEMFESIGTYLPNQASYLSIDESTGNFLSMRELNEIIIPIFKNIGFIDNSQNLDYLAPEEVTDTVMSHRLSKINGGNAFEKGKPFNKAIFGELLQQTNKV